MSKETRLDLKTIAEHRWFASAKAEREKNQMKRFKNKTVVVTGGASGIGEASVLRFHAEGANVVISDINVEAGEELSGKLGERAVFVRADVSDFGEVENLMRCSVETFGRLDVLFNNAGIGALGKTVDLSIEDWKRVFAVDLDSVFYGCKAAIPLMKQSGGGAIVNTASLSGLAGDYGFTAYNAAKGGVINYTRAVAIDYAREGIRINALCPGPVSTPIFDEVKAVPGVEEEWNRRVPMGRFARPEEMAAVAVFLASDDASYITGSIISADGGIGAHTGQPDLMAMLGSQIG
jgi:meso-butanediol dehydrogenase/(S,S)-butanediol dehydrogenase/diacetyl reductase